MKRKLPVYMYVDSVDDLPIDNIRPGDTRIVVGCFSYIRYIWTICPKCREGRWVSVQSTRRKNYSGLCIPCFRELQKRANIEMLSRLREEINNEHLLPRPK